MDKFTPCSDVEIAEIASGELLPKRNKLRAMEEEQYKQAERFEEIAWNRPGISERKNMFKYEKPELVKMPSVEQQIHGRIEIDGMFSQETASAMTKVMKEYVDQIPKEMLAGSSINVQFISENKGHKMENKKDDAAMIEEDTQVWKETRERLNRTHTKSIIDVPGIDLDEQLADIIMTFRSIGKYNQYKYTTFSATAPLYLNAQSKTTPLCTTDDELAKLWVFQINQALQKSREAAIENLRVHSNNDVDFESKLDGLFSARCVDISIDPAIGERDDLIKGMHYIGVIVSYWRAERNGNYDAAKKCEAAYAK